MLERDPALARRQVGGAWLLRDLDRLVDDLEDPLARGGRTLCLADPHPERPERAHEHGEEDVERDEAPGDSVPSATMRAPISRTPAWATSGTNEISGT